ncbi:MAG: 4-hydroxythreonine-4-phosphate dehydrogenase [Oleiphilaceae bacterium]|jgi:4-hydroxythreonine-4-phosphate dehydrogenase
MTKTTSEQPPIVVTPGEPAGIGPELCIQLVKDGLDTPIIFMADSALLLSRAKEINVQLTVIKWDGKPFTGSPAGTMVVQQTSMNEACKTGQVNPANALYVLNCLNKAIDGCLAGTFSALVTGPLHKGVINDAGIPFSGHTEHLQARCNVNKVVMMLASSKMKVALATTHLPLADVASSITHSSLTDVIEILITDLQNKFGFPHPRILIAGLNPHAGEGGHMGREEIEVIQPVLDGFKHHKTDLIGPLPADTLFTEKYLRNADAVLAMYHDQGLPVLKYDGFGESVNITLGLPIVRTSVDHGTALDIAGTGQADIGSLKAAISIALQMRAPISNSDSGSDTGATHTTPTFSTTHLDHSNG